MKHIILTSEEIEHKIKRIAYQIYETFVDEKEIILAGIIPNGFLLTQRIAAQLQQITPLQVTLCTIEMDKKNPQNSLATSLESKEYANKNIVIIDDVLNSGSTLIYAVKHFLEVPLQKVKTVVLVDRNHKNFPVKADFKGISLSTSLQEHVHVVINTSEMFAFIE